MPNAYRTVPAATPELTVVAIAHPRSGRVHFFETRGLNFGLSGAGENVVILPNCIICDARRLFAVPADLFTDDAQVIESALSRPPPVAHERGLVEGSCSCGDGAAHWRVAPRSRSIAPR